MTRYFDFHLTEEEFWGTVAILGLFFVYLAYKEEQSKARALWGIYDELHRVTWHIEDARDEDPDDPYERPEGSA